MIFRTILKKKEGYWLEEIEDAEVCDPGMQNWEKYMDGDEFFLVHIVSTIVFVYHFFIGSIMYEDCKNGLILIRLLFKMKNTLKGRKYFEN